MHELELTSEQRARADALHERSIVVDMCCTTNPAQPAPIINGKNGLERQIEGGLTAANNTVAAPSFGRTFRDTIRNINEMYRLIDGRPDAVLAVSNTGDIKSAKAERKLGIVLGFQGAFPLEDDFVNTLPVFQKLGVRVIGLTYNEANLLGSGCTEPHDGGLTAYGRQVVSGLNHYGVIVDLSHAGERTALDAIEVSRHPIIFSHSNSAVLAPHVRNLSDDVMKAVAASGGLIGLSTWSVILNRGDRRPTLVDFLDQIDYVAGLVGVEHVGIGTDRNEHHAVKMIPNAFEIEYRSMLEGEEDYTGRIDGFNWMHEFPNITRGLVARGYSDDQIQKVLGGNFLRVARQVWDKA